jgi:hypothetical protein
MFPVEFVVFGTPVSWRSDNKRRKRKWKQTIVAALEQSTKLALKAPTDEVRVHIRYYYSEGSTVPDLDNLSKPVLDAMSRRVYDDDRQICDLWIDRVDMGRVLSSREAPQIVIDAVNTASDFLYIKVTPA